MQRFIAELSSVIGKAEFDRSWQSEASARAELKVDFAFDGRRVSATIHSESDSPWDVDAGLGQQRFRRFWSPKQHPRAVAGHTTAPARENRQLEDRVRRETSFQRKTAPSAPSA